MMDISVQESDTQNDSDDDILECSYLEEAKGGINYINLVTPTKHAIGTLSNDLGSPMSIDGITPQKEIVPLVLSNEDLSLTKTNCQEENSAKELASIIVINSSDESDLSFSNDSDKIREVSSKGTSNRILQTPSSFEHDDLNSCRLPLMELNTSSHGKTNCSFKDSKSCVQNENDMEIQSPFKSDFSFSVIKVDEIKPNAIQDKKTDKKAESDKFSISFYERCLDDKVCKIKPIDPSSEDQQLSFLSTLSDRTYGMKCDTVAEFFKLHFRTAKTRLARHLYYIFNELVFDNQLPKDMPLKWSSKLLTACGITTTKYETYPDGSAQFTAYITLSKKIITTAERLRDTLVHEMCHAAVWIINNSCDSHGAVWKMWALKARASLPELPEISRCHSYEINYKYIYKCSDCGYRIGRSRPSNKILNKSLCGYCGGKFILHD